MLLFLKPSNRIRWNRVQSKTVQQENINQTTKDLSSGSCGFPWFLWTSPAQTLPFGQSVCGWAFPSEQGFESLLAGWWLAWAAHFLPQLTNNIETLWSDFPFHVYPRAPLLLSFLLWGVHNDKDSLFLSCTSQLYRLMSIHKWPLTSYAMTDFVFSFHLWTTVCMPFQSYLISLSSSLKSAWPVSFGSVSVPHWDSVYCFHLSLCSIFLL